MEGRRELKESMLSACLDDDDDDDDDDDFRNAFINFSDQNNFALIKIFLLVHNCHIQHIKTGLSADELWHV